MRTRVTSNRSTECAASALAPPRRFRIAAFVSHLTGAAVLDQLLGMPDLLTVVLVATDDPSNPVCNPDRRLWRYGRAEEFSLHVPARAAGAGLAAYNGRIEDEAFRQQFKAARLDAIVSAVFGQRVPLPFLELVGHRAWNTHLVAQGEPLWATRGGAPVEAAIRCGAGAIQVCLHWMVEEFDAGEEVARSAPHALPRDLEIPASEMLDVYLRAAAPTAELVRRTLPVLLRGRASPEQIPAPAAIGSPSGGVIEGNQDSERT